MLVLLSPAKSLDYDTPLPTRKCSEPRLLDQAEQLIDVMRGKSVAEIAAMMKISDELAARNAQRYADFRRPFTPRNARPAVLAFAGDVYQGMAVRRQWTERDYTEAQKTVRILSGLYGVLRPLDLVQPYRLEMGVRLATQRGRSLYDWWGSTITDLLRADLAESPGAPVVINLASAEYAAAVRSAELGARVIAPRFEDTDAAGHRSVVGFFAKRARGELASWLVRTRARTSGSLTRFAEAGYTFDRAASSADRPVFVRAYEQRPMLAAQRLSEAG